MPRKDTPATFRDRIKEFRRIPVVDLQDHAGNWRRHPQAQKEALQGLLRDVGIAGALIAYHSERQGGALTLIDGHLRRGMGGEWPVLILDVSDAEADLLLASIDPLAAMAQADTVALDAILRNVSTGEAAVQQMLADLAEREGVIPPDAASGQPPVEDVEPQVDRAEELRSQWGVEPGQLWTLGEHRIICGDSTDAAVVERLLAGARPILMVTDPPYGVDYDPDWRNDAAQAGYASMGRGAPGGRAIGRVVNDTCADWADAWRLSPAEIAYVWHAGLHAKTVQHSLEVCKFEMRAQIVWAKSQLVISRGHYHGQHEPCFYAVKAGATARWIGDRKQTTLWDIQKPQKSETGHGTQKPLECMARPIRNHDAPEVYEPFLGSGTTLIACEQLQRRCYGVEIDPGYVAVVLQRYADATGRQPVLEA